MSDRAQSATIGVAVLLAVTVVSIAALTVTVGSVVEETANASEARSVARAMDDALDAERSGPHERRVTLTEGRLRTVERSVRLLDGTDPVATWSVGGLVYAAGPRRVRYVAGSIVHDAGDGVRLHAAPSVSRRDRALYVGVPILGAERVALDGPTTVALRTNVTHERHHRPGDGVGLAVETETPGVWERQFEAMGATTTRRSFDEDGVPSVVARFGGVDDVYVFADDLHLEVGR
jgi:flagellin-like protein